MPKKSKKTVQEISAESYFPVDESDLKVTIEKKEKPDVSNFKEVIEKKYKGPVENPIEEMKKTRIRKAKGPRKKFPGKTKVEFGKTNKKILKKYNPEKIELKQNGYELIITEKPQAALKISEALGISIKRNHNGVPYYEVERNGSKIVVACAVGHLFTLSQQSKGSGFPVFDIAWKPNFMVRKQDFTKKYYDTILTLVKNAGDITVATDYDIEGEVIGLNVIRYICGQDDAKRMKFSTLTEKELNKSYESKMPVLDWGQAIAGETRHYLDWYYGINLSRALMSAVKKAGRFKVMSIGRVQGPTLNLIVKKEKEIQDFKPIPYWQIFITVKNSHVLELKHIKDIFEKKELDKFKDLNGKNGIASTTKTKEIFPPNPPFNLTTLQIEAYKFYGINPARTLQIAQSLYLSGLISYPRTSSQKLPPSIDYKLILEKLAKKHKVEKFITKDKPTEGKKTDPAHPSIYPTGNTQILVGEDEKIYNLIVRRFLSLFCDDAIIDKKKVSVDVNGLLFSVTGSQITKKAWMEIYPSKLKEEEIPDLNGPVKVINSRIEEKETQPPKRYSQASIISELEKKNLGTKATRAFILETLYDRGYIKEKSIEATQLGMSLINTLEKYSPIIIDEKLTRSFEDSMEAIIKAKGNLKERENKIIEKAKETIIKISKDFELKGKEIGNELVNANEQLIEKEREENKLNICPECKKGTLRIIYSKKTRRQFVACDAYPNCKKTYSLPPDGLIRKAERNCEECGFPKLIRLRKGKNPWEFCFNTECAINKKRLEEYNKNK